jgi:hypothetical protein
MGFLGMIWLSLWWNWERLEIWFKKKIMIGLRDLRLVIKMGRKMGLLGRVNSVSILSLLF